MEEKIKSCENCKHVHKVNGGLECRYNPPVMVPAVDNFTNQQTIIPVFPITYDDLYCGKFESGLKRI